MGGAPNVDGVAWEVDGEGLQPTLLLFTPDSSSDYQYNPGCVPAPSARTGGRCGPR